MSDLDAVRQGVDQAQESARSVVEQCAHAERETRDKADALAGMGVDAMASSLSSAREYLERAGQSGEGARSAAEAAGGELAAIPAQAKALTVLAGLAGAIGKLSEAVSSLAAAESEADDAMRFAADTEVQAAIQSCELVSSAIRDAQAVVMTAQTQATEYRQRLEGLATATAGLARPSSDPRPDVHTKRSPFAEPGEPEVFDPSFPYRRHRDAIERFGWPDNGFGNTSARGLVYNKTGDQVLHNPLRAKKKGTAYRAPKLREPWCSDPEMKTTWHIEGGVAAYMRNTETREMTLWLNLPPCGGKRRPDPKGCDRNIAKILPPGYRLHVHVARESGRYEYFYYEGTGEALL